MTRFLMPLSQAVDLVCHALVNAAPGDIFIRKAPGASIGTLAQAVEKMLGAKTPMQIIGNRHAEKMHETLATYEEVERSEDLGDYLRVPMDDRDLSYDRYFTKGENFLTDEDFTSANCEQLDADGVIALLNTLPEFQGAKSPWE